MKYALNQSPETMLNSRNQDTHEEDSARMAELAQIYYNDLQAEGANDNEQQWEQNLQTGYLDLVQDRIPEEQCDLSAEITEQETKLALKQTKNTSPRSDGIIFNLWKE